MTKHLTNYMQQLLQGKTADIVIDNAKIPHNRRTNFNHSAHPSARTDGSQPATHIERHSESRWNSMGIGNTRPADIDHAIANLAINTPASPTSPQSNSNIDGRVVQSSTRRRRALTHNQQADSVVESPNRATRAIRSNNRDSTRSLIMPTRFQSPREENEVTSHVERARRQQAASKLPRPPL